MELWMRLGQPLEDVIGDHERVLDAWEAGGVRGLVFGRAAFMPSPAVGIHAEAVPAFAPNARVYRALGVEPPPSPRESFPERRAQLDRMLDGAKRRGWVVLIFEPAAFRGPGGEGNVLLDDLARRAYLARAQDTLEAFPQVDGAVPGVETLEQLDDGFPPSFFEGYVADQTRRAIAATGDPERIVPWVDVGRLPHDGDPIPPGDLRAILRASAAAGLRRFLYHNHAHLSPAEWGVISELCGQRWPGPGQDGYRPPDGFHIHPTAF